MNPAHYKSFGLSSEQIRKQFDQAFEAFTTMRAQVADAYKETGTELTEAELNTRTTAVLLGILARVNVEGAITNALLDKAQSRKSNS